jgi:multidrug resistance efflux pump
MNESQNSHANVSVDGSASRPSIGTLSDRVRSLRMPQMQQTPRSGGSWLPWALCLGFAAAGGYVGYLYYDVQKERQQEKETAETAKEEKKASAAKQRELGPGEVVLENKGYVIPVHQIQVSPKVSGEIQELYFKEGDFVEEGKLLAKIEDVNYKSDYERALGVLAEAKKNLEVLTKYRKREIEQAKAKLDEAKAQLVQLETDRLRSRRLLDRGSLADGDYEKSDSAFQAMREKSKQLEIDYEFMKEGPRDVNIQAAEARIKQAEAEVVRTKWNLDNCEIKAPITGTILSKYAEKYNIVNMLSLNLKGSLCDMADLTDIEADLTIQERDVAKVYTNQRCRVRSEAFPEKYYDGFVSRLMPTGDRAKGAVPVRVKIKVSAEEKGQYLKPDMGVIVTFFKDDKKNDKIETKK